MILDELVATSRQRVARARATVSLSALETQAFPPVASFARTLKRPGLSMIGEVKRASPSRGQIVTDFDYRQIATDYTNAGIDAISVLTEPRFFHGDLAYLKAIHQTVPVPLLRKDFIVDPYQVYEARIAGASAVLLIVAVLTPSELRTLITLTHQLGMAALVEAHDQAEIQTAYRSGARIIGINNRNLRDFTVDFSTSIRLKRHVSSDCLTVAESGIKTARDVRQLERAGFNAILIGETLMKAPDKAAQIRQLCGGNHE